MVICLNNTVVILINIYGYNSSYENDLLLEVIEEKILLWLNAYPNALVFIGGDFNIVPDNNLDRLPPKQSASTNSKLKIFMDKFDIIDIWREKFQALNPILGVTKVVLNNPALITGLFHNLSEILMFLLVSYLPP